MFETPLGRIFPRAAHFRCPQVVERLGSDAKISVCDDQVAWPNDVPVFVLAPVVLDAAVLVAAAFLDRVQVVKGNPFGGKALTCVAEPARHLDVFAKGGYVHPLVWPLRVKRPEPLRKQ